MPGSHARDFGAEKKRRKAAVGPTHWIGIWDENGLVVGLQKKIMLGLGLGPPNKNKIIQ